MHEGKVLYALPPSHDFSLWNFCGDLIFLSPVVDTIARDCTGGLRLDNFVAQLIYALASSSLCRTAGFSREQQGGVGPRARSCRLRCCV